MPKLKTHKPTSKRFRISRGGKGKLMRTRQGKSHFRTKKARRMLGDLDEMFAVDNRGIEGRVRRLAPYLKEQS